MIAFKDSIYAYGWFYPVVEFLSMMALALILTLRRFPHSSGALSFGIVVAFLQYGLRFFRPIQDLSEKYNILQGAMAASERIFKLLDTPPTIQRAGPPRPVIERARHRVRARLVRLQGRGLGSARCQLHHRARRNRRHRRPHRRGQNDDHQSAAPLLRRAAGHIRIGGVDIREFGPQDLRRQFGVVLQDPLLFTGTFAENIRLGTESDPPGRD